ncbi:MAG: class I SAM-dependent methyltransferase [Candidatus Limnocylindrales bacterium]
MAKPESRPDVTLSPSELEAIKARQQVTWSAGDFGRVGVTLQVVGEALVEATAVNADERVLDVAAGNGNASLAAARRFARVTSTDYVPELLDQGRRRADADGLDIDFQVADAEALPFEDDAFDVALSTFGVMFAPDQERTARELVRVVRPGGRIGMANWTPDGFLGDLFRVMGRFVPPPAGLRSPMSWGSGARIAELFGASAVDISAEQRIFNFRYASADHWIDFFRTFYGPTHKAFAALDQDRQVELHKALRDLLGEWDVNPGGPLVIPAAYLEVVITTA